MRTPQSFLRVSLTLLALASLLFAGCSSGSDDDLPPSPAPVAPISDVQVYNHPDGTPYAGSVTFTHIVPADNDPFDADVALADIGLTDARVVITDGKLELNMGTKSVASGSLLDFAVLYGLTVTPNTARFYIVNGFTDNNNTSLVLKKQGYIDDTWLQYATEAATVTDSGWNQILGKGWNYVLEDEGDTVSVAVPTGYIWYIKSGS
jgi:hypothetical protein